MMAGAHSARSRGFVRAVRRSELEYSALDDQMRAINDFSRVIREGTPSFTRRRRSSLWPAAFDKQQGRQN